MNKVMDIIYSRRSIRQYKPQQITSREIKEILNAALYAPSARNLQDWHFSVVQNPALHLKLKRILKENMDNSGIGFLIQRAEDPNFDPFFNAPTVVFISGDKDDKFVDISCGAAAQNLMLAAESLHIGSCIIATPELLFSTDKEDELKKELGFPTGYRFICAITLGYKDCEKPEASPRKDDVVSFL
ncbi:MAG: nitroreductase family protein [Anaerolineaceae bacterium]